MRHKGKYNFLSILKPLLVIIFLLIQLLGNVFLFVEEAEANPDADWVVGVGGDSWNENVTHQNTREKGNGHAILEYSNWWDSNWNYRAGITINAADYNRTDYPIEYNINFTEELSDAGCTGTCAFDNNSVRVIEYNETGDVISEVPSQFDEASDYDNQTNATGEVVWILNGTTPANNKRYYFIYFDTTDNAKAAPSYSPSFTATYNADSDITVTYNGNIITVVDIKTGGTRSVACVCSAGGLLQLNVLDGTSSIDPTQDWIIPDEYLAGEGCDAGRVEPYALLEDYNITSGPVRTVIFTQFDSNKPTYVDHYDFTWTFYSGENTELKGRFNWTVAVSTAFNFWNNDWPRQFGIDQSSGRYDNYSTGNTTGVIGSCVFKVDASDRYDSVFDSSGSYPTISFVTTQNNWATLDLTSCMGASGGNQNYLLGHAIDGATTNYSGIMSNLWWFHIYPGVFNNTKTEAFSDSVMSPPEISKGSVDRFYLSGNLTSISKDAETVGSPGDVWKQISFAGTVDAAKTVNIEVDASGSDWVGWTTIATGASSGTTYDIPLTHQKRYAKFRLTLNTSDNSQTSEIEKVTLGCGNVAPNAPTLVSPSDGSYISDSTPTLSANYSDPNSGDTGATNYRISYSSLSDCVDNRNIVASGTSSITSDNDENTTWTPSSSIGSNGTYYWCSQNDDGIVQSSWTEMGSFILEKVVSPTGANLSHIFYLSFFISLLMFTASKWFHRRKSFSEPNEPVIYKIIVQDLD